MTEEGATRHLGLDVGATNLKVTLVEHRAGTWTAVSRDQVPTRLVTDPEGVPDAVVAQLAEVAAATVASSGRIASIGIGVPGLYDPATGRARFLVNVPGFGPGMR